MSAFKDLTGCVFGELTVQYFIYVRNTHAYWICKCNKCGALKEASSSNLNNGASENCNACNNLKLWKHSLEDRRAIAVDYVSGVKNNDIMEKYDVSRSGIYKILKGLNIKANYNRRLK